MPVRLRLFNPSPYGRAGHVTVDWQDVCDQLPFDPNSLVIRDQAGHRLPCQYDPVFSGRAKLSFTLAGALPPVGRDGYDYAYPVAFASVESGTAGDCEEPASPRPEAGEVRDAAGKLLGVKLSNGLLDVWINLIPAPWDPRKTWFSGAATSVVVKRRERRHELLDAYGWEHAAEKRVLQLDRLWLPSPAWSRGERHEIPLFDQPYEVFSRSEGSVRASVTLASRFDYPYIELGSKQERKLICHLFRVLSLYRDADHIIEELFVRGSPDGNPSGKRAVDLTFAAHYFSYMRMRGGLRVSRFENVPDWFAITSGRLAEARKFHCYGFATDVHTSPVVHPSPLYPVVDEAENTFAWNLFPGKAAKCLHLFTLWHAEDWPWPDETDFFSNEAELAKVAQRESESRAGRAWYEFIYKPLTAKP